MKTVKVSFRIAKSWRDQTVGCYGRSSVVYSGRYRLRHLSVDAYNQVNCDHWPNEQPGVSSGVIRSFTAEGIGLMYSQAHVTAKWDGLTIPIFTSSILLCKSMAYVIGVTEKEVPGSIGVPRHVMGSWIMDGNRERLSPTAALGELRPPREAKESKRHYFFLLSSR